MVADIGTRKEAKLEDVNPESSWINGLPWMTSSEDKFPTKSVNQIKLSNSEIEVVTKEQLLIVMISVTLCSKIRPYTSQYIYQQNLIRKVFLKKLEKCITSQIIS